MEWLAAMVRLCLMAAVLGSGAPGPGAVRVDAPDIGWCAFYPYVDVGTEAIGGSGATILSVCSGGWGMAQVEGKYDFSPLDRQIELAERQGLKLALINEINPLYTPEWLRQKVKAAGQSVRDASGAPGAIPSITSPVFAAAQAELVRRTIEHVRERDRKGVVRYYHPGAEWWFPTNERYSPADVARFRAWLRRRYSTVARLNEAWQSRFASFDAVAAPRIDAVAPGRGRPGLATVLCLDEGAEHCSWSTGRATEADTPPGPESYAAATPGRTYTASAWVRTDDLRGYGALVEIAWVGARGGAPVALDDGAPVRGTGGWRRISVTSKAPKDAARAWVLLKVMGSGSADFDDVELREAAGGANLAPNPGFESGGEFPAAWSFQNWGGGSGVRSRYERSGGRTAPGCVRVIAPRLSPSAVPYHRPAAAIHDWSAFWYEAGAEYINSLSQQAKRLDPTRPTVTYLTMSWAFPSEWDESQRSAIAPDEVALRGRDIDVFGMQLCSADGDPFRATACMDLMRKYGKPLWAVDLVDFTSGVWIGYRTMDQITQAVIQHGAEGIIYCAWHIPSVLDYSYHPNMPAADVTRMLGDARLSVEAVRGMRVAPGGAIIQPILPASSDDPRGCKNDLRSFVGWYHILETAHRTADVVTLRELDAGRADLSRYAWVLVPDCAYLPVSALARLREYARRGGRLVSGGRFARFDEIRRPLPAGAAPPVVLPDLGRACAGEPLRDTHAGNTPPLFLWRYDAAAAHRGTVRLAAALGAAGAAALAPADPRLRCVEWAGQGRRAAYLVWTGAGEAPRGRLRLRVRAGGVRVLADSHPAAARSVRRGGVLEVELPRFRSSCIVIAGGARARR